MTDIPALPAGFQLEGAADAKLPALPPGFQVEAGVKRNADGTYGDPPPGEIIHGLGSDYVSDKPELNAVRLSNTDERQNAITGEVLRERAAAVDDGGSDVFPEWMRRTMPLTQGYSFNSADEFLSNLVAALRNPGVLASGGAIPNDPAAAQDLTEKADAYALDRDIAQEMQRQTLDRQRNERPIETIGANVAGALSSGLGLTKMGATLTGRIPTVTESIGYWPMLGARSAAGAVEGGAYGSLAGFFGADGSNENRMEVAKDNLPLSMALGAGAVPVADALVALFRPVVNTWNAMRDPEGTAMNKLAARLAADKTAPDDIAAQIERAAMDGQPDYRMVDAAGKNTQRLSAIAAKTPGEFRNTVDDVMSARQAEQGDRIAGYVDDALGTGGKAFQTEADLAASRATAAAPLYDAAYKAAPPTGQFFDDLLTKPSVQDALPSLEKLAAENQLPVSEVLTAAKNAAGEDIQVPTMRGWDYVKRILDSRVNQLYKAGDTTTAAAVKETRNALRSELGRINPDYAKALASYADDSTALEAIDTGRQVIKARNADEAKSALDKVAASNRDLAKLGASREIGVKTENMRGGQDKTLVFDTPAMKSKLDALIDDPTIRQIMEDRLSRERDMVRSSRTTLGGSTSFENFADEATTSNEGGSLAALLSGQPLRALGLAAGSAMGKMGRYASGITDEGADAIGKYLLSNDPEQIRALSDLFRQSMADQVAPSSIPALFNPTFNAPRVGKKTEKN